MMTKSPKGMVLALTLCALLPGPGTAQAADEGAFVLLLGSDTLAVENFTRRAGSVSGVMTGRSVGRLAYQAMLTPGAGIDELRLQAWPPGQPIDGAPVQDATLTMNGDTAIFVAEGPSTDPVTQRIPTTAGALPYLNPSFLLTEQILRRAREVGGDTATLSLFMLQGGSTIPAEVVWHAADSATVSIGGTSVDATVTTGGRLMSARVPAQNLSVERVEGGHLPPITMAEPDYSAPEAAPYTAEEVRIDTPAGHTLVGTLTRPRTESEVPAVVLVSGSGAQDRDETLPMLPGFRPFREIADSLSRRGIAVLRLDDRGYGESGGDFASATTADFADDTRAALASLGERDGIDGDRLAVVGHSEGGVIAPLVAATDPDVAAIVTIAGPAQTGREIIHYQQRQAIGNIPGLKPAERDSMIAAAREELESMAASQPWLAHFLDYDPLATARRVTHTPVLVLQGETDRQVTADQAEVLGRTLREAGNSDVTVHVFPDINHLMLRDPDGDPAGYSSLEDREMDDDLLGVLVDWLVDRLAEQR